VCAAGNVVTLNPQDAQSKLDWGVDTYDNFASYFYTGSELDRK
jgi:hypothetical protein